MKKDQGTERPILVNMTEASSLLGYKSAQVERKLVNEGILKRFKLPDSKWGYVERNEVKSHKRSVDRNNYHNVFSILNEYALAFAVTLKHFFSHNSNQCNQFFIITRPTLIPVTLLSPISSGLTTSFAGRKKKIIPPKKKSNEIICIKKIISINTIVHLIIFYTMIANLFSFLLILTVSSTGYWFLTQI